MCTEVDILDRDCSEDFIDSQKDVGHLETNMKLKTDAKLVT